MRRLLLLAAAAALAHPASALAASYKTPGYRGTHAVPRHLSAPAPQPLTIGSGEHPSILVDGAGTAHITWNEPTPGGASRLHYCRLPRGARACAAQSVLDVDQPDTDTNSPVGNVDSDGPRPLAVGNELLLLTNRGPNIEPLPGCGDPDCPQFDSNDYLFTSEDGGATFGAPGRIGTNPLSFGAVTFGGESPLIATLSAGPTVQVTHAGQFATDAAALGPGEAGGNGSCCLLAVDPATQRPAVAVSHDGQVTVREWNGQGSPNDAA